jgi:uncharacterized membrane protein
MVSKGQEVKTAGWLKTLNWISLAIPLIFIVYYFIIQADLPSQVAVHYNFEGEADRWGSHVVYPFIACLGFLLTLGLVLLQRIPHKHNYPVKVTEENATRLYQRSNELLGTVAVVLSLGMVSLLFESLCLALGRKAYIGISLAAFIIALLAVILIGTFRIRKSA